MSSGPVPGPARAPDKHERLAKVYDAEVVPAYAGRFAALALRALDLRPDARVVECGCATGHLTLEIARRLSDGGRVSAFDEAPAFLAQARTRLDAHRELAGRVTLQAAAPEKLPLADGAADVAISNLAAAEAEDPRAAVRELARVLAPGGKAVVTAPLRGSWAEFLDIYREVLRENGKSDTLAAVDRYLAALPDGERAARWLDAAGLTKVKVTVARWEILFKSAREFFFAPVIELGPLSRWKHLAGRGEEMQDVFFFTKEAIDTYFKGTVFPLTVVGATVEGVKPGSAA